MHLCLFLGFQIGMSSKGKAKTDSEDGEENPDSPTAQSKENDDPNSMKQLQLELNEIAKDKSVCLLR